MNIGAHVRGGGKLVPSLEYGVEMGATSIQIFTQSPRMWKPSQYAPEVLAAYREAASTHPTITDTFCHATYLINLASADLDLYEKSVLCLIHNLSVARGIGSSGLILHVGSHLGAGFDDVVRQIADAFERTFAEADPSPEGVADCPILIENAAGSGGTVGRSLEEIRFLIDACNGDDRLGLCIDTQHLWASGFDYSSVAGTERLIKEIELSVGMERLRCFHLNDSKIELGGNRDRHANIGEGTIGGRGLAPLVGHPLIRDLPLILEVPGSGDGPRAEDVTVAKQVVTAGIELYDGVANWEESLPVTAVFTPPPVKSVSKTVKAPTKTTAPAKATTKKVAKKMAKKSTKKVAKKVAKKASKKASSKAAKKVSAPVVKKTVKSAKKAAKSAKKLAKKASKKASSKVAKKAAKKLTKSSAKKTTTKVAKSARKLAKKASKKVATKSARKSAKKSTKKLAKKSTKKSAKK
jgi:deoxyribonuclease-4